MRGELAVPEPRIRMALATDHEPARLLLIAGKPLDEPVTRYGPFVMNTEDEIRTAIADFQAGCLSQQARDD